MNFRIVILSVILASYLCSPERVRRVVNGLPFNGRPKNYRAIRYYGALAEPHSNWYLSWKPFWPLEPREPFDFLDKYFGVYGTVHCGGALLTPAIFQTACHCLASYDRRETNLIKPAVIDHAWEGIKVVYFGVSKRFGFDSMVSNKYVLTKKFHVHALCGGIGDKITVTYDYGLVRIDYSWIEGYYDWNEIAFAPVYPVTDIEHFHYLALQKELVCLYVGFGVHDIHSPYAGSYVLRHGWASLLQHGECEYETAFVNFMKKRFKVEPQYFNWACTWKFPQHFQYAGFADSGGPVSCDNRYFAVVSGNKFYRDAKGERIDLKTLIHPIINSMYVNAAGFRINLIQQIFYFGDVYGDPNDRPNFGSRKSLRKNVLFKIHDFEDALVTSAGLKDGPDVTTMLLIVFIFGF